MKKPHRLFPAFRALAAGALLLAAVPGALRAVDSPHDPYQCNDCHSNHAAAGFFGINQTYIQDLCASCHDGVTATEVATHINPSDPSDGWYGRDYDGNGQDIVCIDCHDPHRQRSALGQHFVGFRRPSDGANVLRTTPTDDAMRVILYNSTGTRASFIKNEPDNGICEVCHTNTAVFTRGSDVDTHYGWDTSQACTDCHVHSGGFEPQGGDCIGCHKSAQGSRRQITDNTGGDGEFGSGFTSHHVNDGTTSEIVTKWDCVVCHAEGNVLTGEPDSTYHKVDGVQLKNVDTNAAYADWSTLTAAQRSEFCMSCHDSNGATNVSSRTDSDPDATTDALNPFNDGLTNAHEPDGFDGSTKPHSRSRVIDIETKFTTTSTWASHHAVRGAAYGSAAPFGSPVDNAIQGVRTDLAWNSVINCEDCHYGTSSANLNGHGTVNARYMLRDKNGNDTAAADPNHICYRCHNPSDANSVYPYHDRGAHMDDTLNLYGVSCLNCHGGGEWGGIHGVDAQVTDDDAGGSYNPNVFTYGASLDLITNWASWAKNGVSCSSLNASTKINDCTQHTSQTYGRISGNTRTYRDP